MEKKAKLYIIYVFLKAGLAGLKSSVKNVNVEN
jgi:hypothetical protein